MYVSGGKKCQFSEKRFVRTKRIIAIYISYAAVNQYGPPDLRLLNIDLRLMMKNTFYFILKALFVLDIFTFLFYFLVM